MWQGFWPVGKLVRSAISGIFAGYLQAIDVFNLNLQGGEGCADHYCQEDRAKAV